jgi:hypothetical protein
MECSFWLTIAARGEEVVRRGGLAGDAWEDEGECVENAVDAPCGVAELPS